MQKDCVSITWRVAGASSPKGSTAASQAAPRTPSVIVRTSSPAARAQASPDWAGPSQDAAHQHHRVLLSGSREGQRNWRRRKLGQPGGDFPRATGSACVLGRADQRRGNRAARIGGSRLAWVIQRSVAPAARLSELVPVPDASACQHAAASPGPRHVRRPKCRAWPDGLPAYPVGEPSSAAGQPVAAGRRETSLPAGIGLRSNP